mmetsp:Transcript_74358/g.155030  ORF Transcript_74358/g.155030 Transcript_74358/m.155030 type:complete len:207 (-) Transcript_74358:615-1235(-)
MVSNPACSTRSRTRGKIGAFKCVSHRAESSCCRFLHSCEPSVINDSTSAARAFQMACVSVLSNPLSPREMSFIKSGLTVQSGTGVLRKTPDFTSTMATCFGKDSPCDIDVATEDPGWMTKNSPRKLSRGLTSQSCSWPQMTRSKKLGSICSWMHALLGTPPLLPLCRFWCKIRMLNHSSGLAGVSNRTFRFWKARCRRSSRMLPRP